MWKQPPTWGMTLPTALKIKLVLAVLFFYLAFSLCLCWYKFNMLEILLQCGLAQKYIVLDLLDNCLFCLALSFFFFFFLYSFVTVTYSGYKLTKGPLQASYSTLMHLNYVHFFVKNHNVCHMRLHCISLLTWNCSSLSCAKLRGSNCLLLLLTCRDLWMSKGLQSKNDAKW